MSTQILRRLGSGIAIFAALSLALPAVAASGAAPSELSNGDESAITDDVAGSGTRAPIPEGFISRNYYPPMMNGELASFAESTLATLVADAMYKTSRTNPDLARAAFVVFNTEHLSGALQYREDALGGPGAVWGSQIRALFSDPDEEIWMVRLTGDEVVQMLNEQYQRPHGHAMLRLGISSNLSYIYENTGSGPLVRIRDVILDNEYISGSQTYDVIVAGNLVERESPWGFPTLQGGDIQLLEYPLTWSQALTRYFNSYKPDPIPNQPMQRSIGWFHTLAMGESLLDTSTPLEEGTLIGTVVSSLAYTNADEMPDVQVLDVQVNNELVGRYVIDCEDVLGTDETGQTFVRFVVPPMHPGINELIFTIDGNVIMAIDRQISRSPRYRDYIDVSPDDYFAYEIDWITVAGVSTGWKVGANSWRYGRYEPVLRDQMAAFLFRLAAAGTPDGLSYTPPTRSPFVDVPTNHVFYKEIAWLAENGIANGWPRADGKREFRPYSRVLRDQMAAFLFRLAAKLAPVMNTWREPLTSEFADMGPGKTFNREIQWMGTFGISEGWMVGGQRYYRPYQPVLRDQMAAFLLRTHNVAVAFPADLPSDLG